MFQTEQKRIIGLLNELIAKKGFQSRQIDLRKIPFSGSWGFATSIAFQLSREQLAPELESIQARLPKKEAKKEVEALVRERTNEVASELAQSLSETGWFEKVEPLNGYVNMYFNSSDFANRVIGEVQSKADRYGWGEGRTDRVMVEYSQPNTHKAFHIGHLRNACLGDALARIMQAAGYDVTKATYGGDIGMHVIKCLWCYLRFHKGEEPKTGRGVWLGAIYAEADSKLNYRNDVIDFLGHAVRQDERIRDAALQFLVGAKRDPFLEDDALALETELAKPEPRLAQVRSLELLRNLWVALASELQNIKPDFTMGLVSREQALERYAPDADNVLLWDQVDTFQQEVKDLFQAWDRKDEDLVELWERTRQWSIDEFAEIYEQLDVTFDVWFWESEVEEEGREIVGDLLERGVAEISDGAAVVKIDEKLGLEKETYRTLPILRSDGTTLYSTKDLALAKQKFEQFHIDKSIYVVDVRQSLYFQQIFKILELWGFPQAIKCYHLPYEIVTLPEGKMASRAGNVILYETLADEVFKRARQIIDEKNPELTDNEKDRISKVVGIASMKYGMLDQDNNKQVVFDWDEALNFDGRSAPYIQYSYARGCRIIEKSETGLEAGPFDFDQLEPVEINLIEKIADFSAEVERSAEQYKPLYLAMYVYELAKLFNDFYRECPVLRAEPAKRKARLALVDAARQTIGNGLSLLGIEAPSYM